MSTQSPAGDPDVIALNQLISRPNVYRNLHPAVLVEHSLRRGEGTRLAANGALVGWTGKRTGRSPKDKFTVKDAVTADKVHWGEVNQPFDAQKFEALYSRVLDYLKTRDLYVQDLFAGADPQYRLPIRVINEFAWHSLFVRDLFIRPTEEELQAHAPEFTVVAAPTFLADPQRDGTKSEVFNFEGGCYAKTIKLSRANEPQIYGAIRLGAVLENLVLDDAGAPDYDDDRFTENTRAAYPVDFIENAVIPGVGGHPKNVVFLTADAFGVLPPTSRLTPEQAMYHFLSGYTAKVAGTEAGVQGAQATFSTAFGAPFLPLRPKVYAEMLGRRLREHNAQCWLVNTGWTGGGYGVGHRFSLPYTRAMRRALLGGRLAKASFVTESAFGLSIPTSCPDVPSELLNPRNAWRDKNAYDRSANELAERFAKNFEKFEVPEAVREAGPAPVAR